VLKANQPYYGTFGLYTALFSLEEVFNHSQKALGRVCVYRVCARHPKTFSQTPRDKSKVFPRDAKSGKGERGARHTQHTRTNAPMKKSKNAEPPGVWATIFFGKKKWKP
jgi:hypothetical protein